MTFEEIPAQVREQLQREGRVAYRILRRRFDLSDDDLEDLKADLIDAKRLAVDEEGKVLVWKDSLASSVQGLESEDPRPQIHSARTLDPRRQTLDSAAERRQLTVMFCDLVGSTALSEQLDPEDLREVIRTYQETCAAVIQRYAGHIAQHLGDGLLVYFGYPVAHEDDAQRAVRTGLEIIAALQHPLPFRHGVPSPLAGEGQGEGVKISAVHTPHPNLPPQGGKELRRLQARIGIHTGLVVIGEIGSSEKREILALGETPNIAARLQSLAEPDTVVISAATHRLVQGFFTFRSLGSHTLKGLSTAMEIYQVFGESATQSRFEAAVYQDLTPMVGREEELGLLQRRWEQAKDGAGQVVLLNGEPGIGKSRLVQELKDQVSAEGTVRIEFRCSPYHQNSAFYPLTEHLRRLLRFASQETPQAKLSKLQQALAMYRFPQADTLPLLAALLSLPHPEGAPPLTLSPQKQKQKTQETLVAWIIEEAEQSAMFCAWEDLHWADPSTLEVLTHFLEQIPTIRMFSMLTCRPDFTPPWGLRSYITPLTLSRLCPGVVCLSFAAWVLWLLGYPDQALRRSHEALTLAQELSHPFSLAYALEFATKLHQFRREGQAVQEQAEAVIALSTEQGFPVYLAQGTIRRGSVLAMQGQVEEGISQIRQGMVALQATGAELWRPYCLALLAAAYGKGGQVEEGLIVLAEALAVVDRTGERMYEAELYRLYGELILNAERGTRNDELKTSSVHRSSFRIHRSEEAEAYFLKAIEVAQKQQAKSLELRAMMSLARLWWQQGKQKQARKLLAEVYGWFTEGFDTADLKEAKTLLEELV